VTEHPQWCEKQDDPIAVVLWKSKQPVLLQVRCGARVHRLAKVYAANSKRWLCMPGFDFVAQFFEQGEKHHGDVINHMHAALRDLDAVEDDQIQRCSHGTYLIRIDRVRDALDRSRKTLVAEWAEPSESHKAARNAG
jgi:hypothetical protein